MRIMVVSDVHYDAKVVGGYDERRAWDELLGLVELVDPDIILGCGDWGRLVTKRELRRLVSRVPVLTIYGNHDRVDVLLSTRNVLGEWRGTSVLMEEGRVYSIGGLRVAGIHGVVSSKRLRGDTLPRSVSEYLRAARKLQGKNVELLLIHEAPYIPGYNIYRTDGSITAARALEAVKPLVAVGGHLHFGYMRAEASWGLYIHIDTSMPSKTYLVVEPAAEKLYITVYRWEKILESIVVPRGRD